MKFCAQVIFFTTVAASGALLTIKGDLHVKGQIQGDTTVYNVKMYGAIGNGSNDDTDAIQSAIDACDNASGGTVYFPNGTYKISGTNGLIVANANTSHGGQHYVSLLGQSEVSTVIAYDASTNGVGIVLFNANYVTLENFSLNNISGNRGSTIGIILTGDNWGTHSYGGYARMIAISGFSTCIDGGSGPGYKGTSSEWIFDSVTFSTSDVGFLNHDLNGLNFMFRMLQAYSVGIVVNGATAGISIDGGSWSGCGTGFICHNGGTFSIRNVRAESQSGPFVDTEEPVVIENCLATFANSATNMAIRVKGGRDARIVSCLIGGSIIADTFQRLTIEDTGVSDSQVVRSVNVCGTFNLMRNTSMGPGVSYVIGPFPDQVALSADATVMFGTNSFSASSTNLFYNGRKVAFEP